MSVLTPAHYWADRTAPNRRRSYPRLRGDHTADVVVIGGGLTGTAAAYTLAHAGAKVILLEADQLAGGQTASGIGVIVPEPDALIRDVEAFRTRGVARLAWDEARRSAADFASALKKLATKSDLEPAEMFINAPDGAAAALLKREQAARKEARVAAPWVPAVAVRRDLATDSDGAIRLHEASRYDPVRAALGLAGAAEAKGARLFERSRVTRTRFTRKYADVLLDGARIRTTGVVVATGEPGAVFGQLRRHVRYQDGYVVVTAPLNAAMRREVGRRTAVMTDRAGSTHWLRWLAEDRVLFAGAAQPVVAQKLRDRALVQRAGQLMYELSLRYPAVSGVAPAWSWDVPVVTTMDGLPWIGAHRNYPFHFFAIALGWHGDAISWFAARAAARHFCGEPKKEDDAFGFLRAL
jgi:glycine/D-amino acid oxidase-like deaminating enzyme